MRILQVIQKPQARGAEIFASQLSRLLVELGHEVQVISLFPGDTPLPFNGPHIRLNRRPWVRSLDFWGWKKLAHHIDEFAPDVVQANAGDTLKYAILSKVFFGWRTPVIFRNASVMSAYIRTAGVRIFYRLLFKQVSFVASVSEESKRDLENLFPFLRHRAKVVPIGIMLPPKQSYKSVNNYLLHVGGFTFEKNHEGLLRIFKNVVNPNDPLELWLVGDGPLRKQIERKAREMGLESQVRFLGVRSDVSEIMGNAHALLLPSIIEGLPSVMLEAMYHQVPVVAYDVGGISEVISNGVTGWLVEPEDENGFVKAIQDVLKNRGESITQNAFRLVKSTFDLHDVARKFEGVYKLLLHNESQRG